MRRVFFLALVFSAIFSAARDRQENWIQVRSEHFVVATNASEKQGRRIADQFERMRSVFHIAFPKLQIDPGSPIIVLAIKDEKDFRALEPEAYLAKGQLKLGGLFQRAQDKNYVLMRLDVDGEHPYQVIYHEYTHLLLAKAAEWLPLWLNEGLAEFYQNTTIRDKDVLLGEVSGENLALLRQERLLPLTTLFTVDERSPYYHEENKGSIFYAESWAFTHYLRAKDFHEKTHRLTDYSELLMQKVDPVEAATRAFGDLQKLDGALHKYVQQQSFTAFRMDASTDIDDSTFKTVPMTPVVTDALRADFLAYIQRTADARSLLDHVLQEDPNNVSAHETMGFLEFRAGHLDEAKNWYAKAVQLDSQSYLAHYYFAAISMARLNFADDAQVEKSLRTAMKLNPSFPPAVDLLAACLARRRENLEEAHTLGLTAIGLDPGNVHYRMNVANVLMAMGQGKNAVLVLQAAAKLAKTPQDAQMVDNFLMHLQEYVADQERRAEQEAQLADNSNGESHTKTKTSADVFVPKLSRRDTFIAKGPHRFLVGVLKDIHCDTPQMDLTVASSTKKLTLHSDNYYKIQFSAFNFTPSGDLNPCKDLEGKPAKVEYVESADQAGVARVLSVELHK